MTTLERSWGIRCKARRSVKARTLRAVGAWVTRSQAPVWMDWQEPRANHQLAGLVQGLSTL